MQTAELKKEVAARWDRWASNHDNQYAHGLKTEREKQAWLNLLRTEMGASGKKILDVGTGRDDIILLVMPKYHGWQERVENN
ncbi:MAG: hypothetical protein VR69_03715 [Peptococcaceae bacterium BRH_c4b]|nr:MAG: hypothetical protein VR69_03715 [Peptococcaceae bacterium BRH_c4b]